MPDYISSEAAAQILRKEAANHYPTPFHVGLLAAARVIEAIPAADVRPVVRGKWVRTSYRSGYGYKCSVCGDIYHRSKNKLNFCPNCGAVMEES